MDLLKKFEKGAKSHTYQRIDSKYKVDIFLGYNDDGNMSMVITGYSKDISVKSSKFINVKLNRRGDGKLALVFDLLDDTYKSMFLIFCKDIIMTCEKVGTDMAIYQGIMRWKYWKEMFGKKKINILDKSEIKGLIGELLVLRDYFMKKWDVAYAVESWMGPLLGHKDFEIDETWYEVKSLNENAIQVMISSLEQLESENNGHLVIVKLESTSAVTDSSINLNEIVISILDRISDPDVLDLFCTKLDNIGYAFDSEYDNYNFFHKSTELYYVDECFPRLRRSTISPTIGNVKYTIMLDGISEFKEDFR